MEKIKKSFMFSIIILILVNALYVENVKSDCLFCGDWEIEGDTVYIDDDRIYASATPHTIHDTDDIVFELESKQFSGEIDLIWGFNQEFFKPKNIMLWKNFLHHNYTYGFIEDYGCKNIYNVYNYTNLGIENYNNYTVDIGTINNTYLFKINYNYDPLNETCYNIICAFSTFENNGDHYTLCGNYNRLYKNWNNESYYDWQNWNINYNHIKYDYDDMSDWYIASSINIEKDIRYKAKLKLELEKIDLNVISGKYWFAFKKTSDTLLEAIINNRFYALDPWFNGQWKYRVQINVTNEASGVASMFNITYSAGGDYDCNSNCQNDFDDLRFAYENGTLLPYYFERIKSSSYVNVWVNNTYKDGDKIFMYYGNILASNISNGENTFYFFDDGEIEADIDTIWDAVNDADYSTNYNWGIGDTSINCDYSGGLSYVKTDADYYFNLDDWHVILNVYCDANAWIASLRKANDDVILTVRCNPDAKYYNGATYVDTTYDISFDTWERHEFLGYAGNDTINWYVDNIEIGSSVKRDVWDNIAIVQVQSGTSSGDVYFDTIMISKCSAPMPSFEFGDEEASLIDDFIITNVFPSDNSYWCYDVTNLTEVRVDINNTYGNPFNVNITFNGVTIKYQAVNNGTYNLSIGDNLVSGTCNLSWIVNITANICVTNCTMNFSYSFNVCWDALLFLKLNASSGDDNIFEIELTQLSLFIEIIMFIIFLWIGFNIESNYEHNGSKKEWRFIPISYGMFQMMASIALISMGATLATYLNSVFSGFIVIAGIILLFYSVIKSFYYNIE